MSINMCGYMRRISENFASAATALGITVKAVKTPHSFEKNYTNADEVVGTMTNMCKPCRHSFVRFKGRTT